jgi:hypothetical protein
MMIVVMMMRGSIAINNIDDSSSSFTNHQSISQTSLSTEHVYIIINYMKYTIDLNISYNKICM